jgi:hypothetical protein
VEHSLLVGGSDVEVVFIDCDAIGVFALDQDHADRRGCDRNPENEVHCSPKSFAS